MATPTRIDWSNYTSDGDPDKCVGKSSTRGPKYLEGLLSEVNKNQEILANFGKLGTLLCVLGSVIFIVLRLLRVQQRPEFTL